MIEAYESIRSDLKPLEKKRLEYAHAQVLAGVTDDRRRARKR